MLCRFLLSCVTGLTAVSCAAGAVRYVSPEGTDEVPYLTPETAADSIQTALDCAAPGDVVVVLAGTYEEKVRVEKPVTLIGEGKELCRLVNPDPSFRYDNLTLLVTSDATVQGLTVSGGYCGIALDAPQPLLADCRISDAYNGVECRSGSPTIARCDIVNNRFCGVTADGFASPAILECLIGENGIGIWCDAPGATPLVAGCIIRENGAGVIVEGPWASVDRCLIVFNGYAVRLGMDSECAGSVSRCTMALNGHWGLAVLDSGVAVDRSIVWSPPFGAIEGCVRPENITRTMATLARQCYSEDPLQSPGLLLTDNPGFVGWGPFNNTDNPIHVDASAAPGGDGTKDRPLRSIQDVFYSFDFRLAADSPAVGAFGHGGFGEQLQPIGYYTDQPLAERSGSLAVTMEVAPGTYSGPSVTLPPGCNVLGNGSSRPVLRHSLRLWQGVLGHLTFDGYGAYCTQGVVEDCRFVGAKLGLAGGHAARCTFTGDGAVLWIDGSGSVVRNCLFYAIPYRALDVHPNFHDTRVVNCTFYDCHPAIFAGDWGSFPPAVVNSVFWHNTPDFESAESVPVTYSLVGAGYPGDGNIDAQPIFSDAENGDFRLLPDSACIDAGFNDPELPETDIVGMHRIMFGGKSLTVDMGAYEFYINDLTRGPSPEQTTFTWSSLAEKTYSIFYSPDLLTWRLALPTFPSSGNTTTSWTDDGSLTGLAPSLVRRRFYRTLEDL